MYCCHHNILAHAQTHARDNITFFTTKICSDTNCVVLRAIEIVPRPGPAFLSEFLIFPGSVAYKDPFEITPDKERVFRKYSAVLYFIFCAATRKLCPEIANYRAYLGRVVKYN